jgi:para-aminobenzoate synthetase / 4-amino-4-deoxychorismate lyase
MPQVPLIRFDTLDSGCPDRAFTLEGYRGEIDAHSPDQVAPAIEAIEVAVRGGAHAAGFIAYEASPAFEPKLGVRPPRADLPLLWFGLFDERVEAEPLKPPDPDAAEGVVSSLSASLEYSEYAHDIDRILEWIAAGDTYQVNHTFRLHGDYTGSDTSLYRRICTTQRAGYCALLRLPRISIISASPELFFRLEADRLEMRPMKGTRRRGRWSAEDDALADELLASQKERAENLMIVDLLRNDAGRVARFGSVHVPDLFRVERYPTVHQMTSTVTARLRPGTSLLDVLRAVFPSGSVTGAPKIRTSQIIAELEPSPRGVYTGAIGFISPGETVFSVAIRTLTLDRPSGRLEMGVGSGITSDSTAPAEYAECMQKAAFVHHGARPFRLLTSLRYEPGKGYLLLEAHLARLSASAVYFGYRFDAEAAQAELEAAAARLDGPLYKVRLLVDRCGDTEVETLAIPTGPTIVRLGIASGPVDENDPFLYHKTTQRDNYTTRLATRPDCDDVVLLNGRGELACCTTGNLVLARDGERLTPPLDAGVLAGIFREHLLRRGEIREHTLRPADLARAERVWIINSVRCWRPATLVG